MQRIRPRRDTSHVKEQNHEQDRKDDPLKGFRELLELAYYSYQLKTVSCLRPDRAEEELVLRNDKSFEVNPEIAIHASMIYY